AAIRCWSATCDAQRRVPAPPESYLVEANGRPRRQKFRRNARSRGHGRAERRPRPGRAPSACAEWTAPQDRPAEGPPSKPKETAGRPTAHPAATREWPGG